jgi:hypothetical protein
MSCFRLLFIIGGILLFSAPTYAALGDFSIPEAARYKEEADEAKEWEKRRAQRIQKEALQSECDQKYDDCFDKARKNLSLCGTADVCSESYIQEKKVCTAKLEKCEQTIKENMKEIAA